MLCFQDQLILEIELSNTISVLIKHILFTHQLIAAMDEIEIGTKYLHTI